MKKLKELISKINEIHYNLVPRKLTVEEVRVNNVRQSLGLHI
jgi:hypothetical protein